ncbi:DUF975 family protein [Vagococcus fluvialis]|uniref:DUF975 family protein n=1 Tax=Vagococcus fluvialis TaxID=2738 RepID=UPI003B5C2564
MYKTSGQLKQEARNSLQGRWKEAVILNLVPSLLQMISMFLIGLLVAGMFFFISMFATSSSFESFESQSNVGRTNIEQMFDEDFFEDEVDSWYQEYNDDYSSSSSSIASAAASASSSSFMAPIMNLVISFLMVGISFTFLDVVRRGKDQSMEFKDAFRVFNGIDFIPIFLINILTYIFTALWSLLFVIPGIIKSYSYSQSYFIYKDLATHKDVRGMGATSFISESRDLMHGHKGRLFWLDVSFIGWYLLGFLTLGIGLLWINPYVTTTKAAFYNDLAKDKYLSFEEVEEEDEEWTSF